MLYNPHEIRLKSKELLDKSYFDFIDAGAGNQSAINKNRKIFSSISLTGRVLAGIKEPQLKTTVYGLNFKTPLAIAPMAFHGLVTKGAEIETAIAAQASGVPLILSSMSTTSFQEIANTGVDFLFQLYFLKDKKLTQNIAIEAVNHGAKGIVLTVDTPVFGYRPKDKENNFRIPKELAAKNRLRQLVMKTNKNSSINMAEEEFTRKIFKSDLNWKDVIWLTKNISVPVILKGILSKNDAEIALENGAAGVIVSNHGGRQCDTHPGSLEVLPTISDLKNERENQTPFIGIDGSFETASDILKGLALGANQVLLGRIVLHCLKVGGVDLLHQYLSSLHDELKRNLIILGLSSIQHSQELTMHRDTYN